jgi:glycosyltransferase involved in cell wall biosynthesis
LNAKPIRVTYLGLRGFPGVQGGVETHAEHLCPLLVEMGCDVEVIVRSPYQNDAFRQSWKGVRFKPLWSPKSKSLETIVHTFLGVLYAGFVRRPDVLHIQAIGPALMTPLARLLGLRVVVTHHGPDYDRQKWGRFGKFALRLGERFGMRWSNGRIVISEVIRSLVREKHGVDSTLIPNGVTLPKIPASTKALDQFGLMPGKYIVLVSRLVPEKRHMELIEAFRLRSRRKMRRSMNAGTDGQPRAGLEDWKLAIVGASDHPDVYTLQVLETAGMTPGVVCTGFQSGQGLRELYAHAGMFVLPSSHEGLPIAMLEALSYGLPVVASDIAANVEVGLSGEHYFHLGDVDALAVKLTEFAARPVSVEARNARRVWVSERYDWVDIARQTMAVYQKVVSGVSD